MKYILFFICAIVAVQGFQIRPVEKNFPSHLQKASNKDLDDVIDAIHNAIERIREIINGIVQNLPEIIQAIRDKIQEIIAEFPDIIQAIRDRIQQLIEQGRGALECVRAEREAIEAVIGGARNGIRGCIQAAEGEIDPVIQELRALISLAQSVSEDIVNRALTCIRDNLPNATELVQCLREQVDPIREQLVQLHQQVVAVVDAAREVAEHVAQDLRQCLVGVHNEYAPQLQAIIDNVRECIAQN